MKRFRKWRRMLILSLLCLFMCAPLALMSNRLKTPSLQGPKDFLGDLSSIRYRAHMLRLNAIEEEDTEGLKEPKQQVYKDQKYSIVRYSSADDLKVKQSDYDRTRVSSLGRKGAHHGLIKQKVKARRKKASPANLHKKTPSKPTKKQHVDVGMSRDDDASYLHMRRALNETVKEMKDQRARGTAYLSFATTKGNIQLEKELKQRIKEIERALGEVKKANDLTRSAFFRIRNMEATLTKASRMYPNCSAMVEKLKELTQEADEQIQSQRKQTEFLTQLAGRTAPKGLHCLSMRLTTEYFAQTSREHEPVNQLNLYNPDLPHYVVFSDNVLACEVVVNSTISSAKEPEKIVFHVVTSSLNFPEISMWFIQNPPGRATIQVKNIDNFKILLAKYGNTDKENSSNRRRYYSPIDHLRFLLPELFPHLDKIILLDHDVVVLKDLSDLWRVDMKGKVNGVVQTCHQGEHFDFRMDTLVNFSDPWVAENFDVNSCTWAFGMNLFDLREWRRQDLSAKYHKYLLMGYERPLWKHGSLPLGWVTFYNHTVPLDASWVVYGLGHDVGVSHGAIKQANVIHYDGIMKPWLDIKIKRYKGYWTKYINFDHPYLQQCNIHG